MQVSFPPSHRLFCVSIRLKSVVIGMFLLCVCQTTARASDSDLIDGDKCFLLTGKQKFLSSCDENLDRKLASSRSYCYVGVLNNVCEG